MKIRLQCVSHLFKKRSFHIVTPNGINHSIHEVQGYEWKETYYIPFSRVLKRDLLKPKVKSQIAGKLFELMTYSSEDDFELIKEINTDKLKEWVRQNRIQVTLLEKAVGI